MANRSGCGTPGAGADPGDVPGLRGVLDRALLRTTGEIRADLSDGDRGWTPQRFGDFLVDAWKRLLLATSG
jgi:hypothetical protein